MPAVIAPLQFLIDVLEQLLLFFHNDVGFGWGLSIIFMTLSVRVLLLPLTYKQLQGMRAMQGLSPKMKELQAKYKGDKERLGQEMQKMYREHGVNPLSSCLPLVAQFPFFISLFYMLRHDLKADICGPSSRIHATAHQLGRTITNTGCDRVDPGSAKFLFIHDVTASAHGGVLILLLGLYVGSQLLSMLFMRTTAIDPNTRYLMMVMPFFFLLLVRNFPAGLLVYWITTNLWTFGQGAVMRRFAPPIPSATVAGEDDKPQSPFAAISAMFKPDEEPVATKPARNGSSNGRSARNGTATATKTKTKAGATAASSRGDNGGSSAKPRPSGPPPSSPRKKKKRSGRRR